MSITPAKRPSCWSIVTASKCLSLALPLGRPMRSRNVDTVTRSNTAVMAVTTSARVPQPTPKRGVSGAHVSPLREPDAALVMSAPPVPPQTLRGLQPLPPGCGRKGIEEVVR